MGRASPFGTPIRDPVPLQQAVSDDFGQPG